MWCSVEDFVAYAEAPSDRVQRSGGGGWFYCATGGIRFSPAQITSPALAVAAECELPLVRCFAILFRSVLRQTQNWCLLVVMQELEQVKQMT